MQTYIRSDTKRLEILGYDGGSVSVYYDNLGEPYREGVRIDVQGEFGSARVLMSPDDVFRLRNKLNEFLGERSS